MRTFKTAAMTLALPGALATVTPAGAVPAIQPSIASAYQTLDQSWEHGRGRGHYRDYGYGQRYYAEPAYAGQVWRGRDGRYYCRRSNGTTGLIVGGAAGALLGREIAGRGDRTLGAILGGAGGALLGREIQRSGSRCR